MRIKNILGRKHGTKFFIGAGILALAGLYLLSRSKSHAFQTITSVNPQTYLSCPECIGPASIGTINGRPVAYTADPGQVQPAPGFTIGTHGTTGFLPDTGGSVPQWGGGYNFGGSGFGHSGNYYGYLPHWLPMNTWGGWGGGYGYPILDYGYRGPGGYPYGSAADVVGGDIYYRLGPWWNPGYTLSGSIASIPGASSGVSWY